MQMEKNVECFFDCRSAGHCNPPSRQGLDPDPSENS